MPDGIGGVRNTTPVQGDIGYSHKTGLRQEEAEKI